MNNLMDCGEPMPAGLLHTALNRSVFTLFACQTTAGHSQTTACYVGGRPNQEAQVCLPSTDGGHLAGAPAQRR